MTTNYIIRLNKTFIRPGCINKKIELGLVDNKIIIDFFCLVFKLIESNIVFIEDAQVIINQKEKAKRIKQLAKRFTIKILELKFSLAEIFLFFLEYKKSPEEAINNIEQLISKPIKIKSKPLETSTEIARDPKLVPL
jgi:mitochondrial chaperone BCS1